MKLNRLMGILLALLLLVNMTGTVAEEVRSADAQAQKQPLYIVLADCGWMLYGEGEPNENSAVTQSGDPDGLALNLVESLLPAMVEENAMLAVYGYHSELQPANAVEPVSVTDKEGVHAQVQALRELTGRQSSLLNVALKSLDGVIGEYQENYDCRLVILSGGAVNYYGQKAMDKALAEDPPLASIAASLEGLRSRGVAVYSYVWDVRGAGHVKTPEQHPQVDQLLLTAETLGEEMIPAGTPAELVMQICNRLVRSYAERNGLTYAAGAAYTVDRFGDVSVKDDDIAIVRNTDNSFEFLTGKSNEGGTVTYSLLARIMKRHPAAVLLYVSDREPTEEELQAMRAQEIENKMNALMPQLENADLTLAVGEDSIVIQTNVNLAEYTIASDNENVFTASCEGSALTLSAVGSGTANLSVAFGDGEPRKLNVNVFNYGMNWLLPETQILYVGQEVRVAECVDAANQLTGTVLLNDVGMDAAAMTSELRCTPAEPGVMNVTLTVADRGQEKRSYKVFYNLPEGEMTKSLTLKYPYYGVQADQTVQILGEDGIPVSLSGFKAEIAEPLKADVFFDDDGTALYIAPKGAGSGVVTLTHETSGQVITLNVTVNSLFSGAGFWLLAAGVPVCLIGLTTMVVLLIVKLGGKRR